jgi:hypothetical protein
LKVKNLHFFLLKHISLYILGKCYFWCKPKKFINFGRTYFKWVRKSPQKAIPDCYLLVIELHNKPIPDRKTIQFLALVSTIFSLCLLFRSSNKCKLTNIEIAKNRYFNDDLQKPISFLKTQFICWYIVKRCCLDNKCWARKMLWHQHTWKYMTLCGWASLVF